MPKLDRGLRPHSRHRAKVLIYSAAVLAGLLLDAWFAYGNRSGWGVDFNQFYAASHLAGSGKLYDWDALQQEELKQGVAVHTARLPIVAYGTKIISWLPYRLAQIVWFSASIGCLVLMVLIWPNANKPALALVLIWSFPAVLLLVLGQDTPFWLLFCAAGFALLKRGKSITAGVVLAMCACKFHLTAGIAVVLFARQRWLAVGASAITCILLLSSCFLIEGATWPQRYLAVFRGPSLSPAIERMPNLRGLSQALGHPLFMQAMLSILFLTLLFAAVKKTEDIGLQAALATGCGLVLAPHGYANDCALLVPLVAFWLSQTRSNVMSVWSILLMTPMVILPLASNHPFWGQLLIIGFVAAALVIVLLEPPVTKTRISRIAILR